jgi:hypothetical protein
VEHATAQQVAFYREHGYLKLGRIFTREELEALREHVDAKIAALPAGARPEAMDRPHFEDPWLFRYLTHPRVLDGSHREAAAGRDQYQPVDRDRNVFGSEILPELIDEARIVDLELAAGECHFHDAWTAHSSCPNTSAKRRCGYTMRYMPAHVRHHNDERRSHRIYLVRGEDRTGGYNVYTPIPPF